MLGYTDNTVRCIGIVFGLKDYCFWNLDAVWIYDEITFQCKQVTVCYRVFLISDWYKRNVISLKQRLKKQNSSVKPDEAITEYVAYVAPSFNSILLCCKNVYK